MDNFIKNYSEIQKTAIEFRWNGEKDDDKWNDENLEFRREIVESILRGDVIAPDVLVRDLFEIEAVFCREAFGAGQTLADLGDLLLNQTGARYIESYFAGKAQSFDTENTVIPYGVTKSKLESIVEELNELKVDGSRNEDLDYYISYLEAGLFHFQQIELR